PSVNGVQWFAAWRTVDNAAAINLNTAWGPYPYPANTAPSNGMGGVANRDSVGAGMTFFPTDVDLFGLLAQDFSPTNNFGSEMATLQGRRVAAGSAGATNTDLGQYWTKAWSENYLNNGYVNRSDVAYLDRAAATSLWLT